MTDQTTSEQEQEKFFFLPLGGAGEIGMNLNLYGYGGKWLLVDFGITFGHELGIDIILPDPEFIVERKKDLAGILLTHGHEDHIGAIPYLWKYLKVPLYATPFTAKLIRHKLKEVGLDKEAKVIEVPMSSHFIIGPFKLQLVTLTHSIPEPCGILIETPVGRVFHSGDWKLDPHPGVGDHVDETALKQIGTEGVLALVCDSTNVFEQGHTGSEQDVEKGLLEAMKEKKGALVVTCFASNVARVTAVLTNARKLGRKVCLKGRSMKRFVEIAQECGYLSGFPIYEDQVASRRPLRDKDAFFITEEEASLLPREDILILTTGSQGESRAGLSRLAWHKNGELELLEGDVVIFSSRVIPGNERAIGHLHNRLVALGCEVITPGRKEYLHVSGHPAQEELRQMYSWLKPSLLIPVHGEARHLVEQEAFALASGIENVIIPSNGALIELGPGRPGIVKNVHAGRLGLDGSVLISLKSSILKERKRLSTQGCAVITIVLSLENEFLQPPELLLFGLIDTEEMPERSQRLLDDILGAVDRIWKELPEAMRESDDVIETTLHSTLRRIIASRLGKKPVTEVQVIRTDKGYKKRK